MTDERRRRVKRTVLLLVLIVLGFYIGIFVIMAERGSGAGQHAFNEQLTPEGLRYGAG